VFEGSSEIQRHEDRIEALREIVNNPESRSYKKEQAREDLDKLDERLTKNIDKVISPFVVFYDLNPGKFAAMPTREFMDKAKEFGEISTKIRTNEHFNIKFGEMIQRFEVSLEEGKGEVGSSKELTQWVYNLFDGDLYNKTIQEYAAEHWPADDIGRHDYVDEKTHMFFKQQFDETLKGSFDKTPRQIIEQQAEILKGYLSLAERAHEEDLIEKQRLEDEAKSVA
jgi:hypothetical protein